MQRCEFCKLLLFSATKMQNFAEICRLSGHVLSLLGRTSPHHGLCSPTLELQPTHAWNLERGYCLADRQHNCDPPRDSPKHRINGRALLHCNAAGIPGQGTCVSGSSRIRAISLEAGTHQVTPNSALNRSANGRPPSPGRRYALHCLRPRLGVLPSSPG